MRTFDRLDTSFAAASAGEASARRCCEWGGCERDGDYRAPRSRSDLRSYRWFCLDHVREYNAAWNYYAGMTDAEVEADLRFDTVWQRPSWPLGAAAKLYLWRGRRIHDGFATYAEEGASPKVREPVTAETRALLVLELQAPVTVAIVKARYKELVKRHHPDANGGDKAAEERFKEINEAYRTVMSSLAP